MSGVLSAEFAVFTHLKPVRVILLILLRCIIALLTLGTRHCNFHSHADLHLHMS